MSFRGYRCPGMLRLSPRFFFFIIRLTALHAVYRDTFPTGYSPAVHAIEHGCHVRGQQGPIALRQQADPRTLIPPLSAVSRFLCLLERCSTPYADHHIRLLHAVPLVPLRGHFSQRQIRDKDRPSARWGVRMSGVRSQSRLDMNHLDASAVRHLQLCMRAR